MKKRIIPEELLNSVVSNCFRQQKIEWLHKSFLERLKYLFSSKYRKSLESLEIDWEDHSYYVLVEIDDTYKGEKIKSLQLQDKNLNEINSNYTIFRCIGNIPVLREL